MSTVTATTPDRPRLKMLFPPQRLNHGATIAPGEAVASIRKAVEYLQSHGWQRVTLAELTTLTGISHDRIVLANRETPGLIPQPPQRVTLSLLFPAEREAGCVRKWDVLSAREQIERASAWLAEHNEPVTITGLSLLTGMPHGSISRVRALTQEQLDAERTRVKSEAPNATIRNQEAQRLAYEERQEADRKRRLARQVEVDRVKRAVQDAVRAYREHPNKVTECVVFRALREYREIISTIPPEVDGFRWRIDAAGELTRYRAGKVLMAR